MDETLRLGPREPLERRTNYKRFFLIERDAALWTA